MQYKVRAKIWQYQGAGGWHFLTLPADVSAHIKALTSGLRNPFGSLRVKAQIGDVAWSTSIFADTNADAFLLPIKTEVRRRANLSAGDEVRLKIELAL